MAQPASGRVHRRPRRRETAPRARRGRRPRTAAARRRDRAAPPPIPCRGGARRRPRAGARTRAPRPSLCTAARRAWRRKACCSARAPGSPRRSDGQPPPREGVRRRHEGGGERGPRASPRPGHARGRAARQAPERMSATAPPAAIRSRRLSCRAPAEIAAPAQRPAGRLAAAGAGRRRAAGNRAAVPRRRVRPGVAVGHAGDGLHGQRRVIEATVSPPMSAAFFSSSRREAPMARGRDSSRRAAPSRSTAMARGPRHLGPGLPRRTPAAMRDASARPSHRRHIAAASRPEAVRARLVSGRRRASPRGARG